MRSCRIGSELIYRQELNADKRGFLRFELMETVYFTNKKSDLPFALQPEKNVRIIEELDMLEDVRASMV